MNNQNCTWEEFKAEAEKLRSQAPASSEVLFRGQQDASWPLDTTLERSGHEEGVRDYYRLIARIRTEIEVATGRQWDDNRSLSETEAMFDHYDGFRRSLPDFPHYAYMAYLRHHGFPSPLLDWSRSPYVAAYFAFQDERLGDSEVAIYAFTDRATGVKTSSPSEPQIHRLGPYVAAHARHFAQQSEYTVCVRYADNRWTYLPHASVFDRQNDFSQDRLVKFVLSAGERTKVLKELNDYNLNAYSLFASVEGLMKAISNREEVREISL